MTDDIRCAPVLPARLPSAHLFALYIIMVRAQSLSFLGALDDLLANFKSADAQGPRAYSLANNRAGVEQNIGLAKPSHLSPVSIFLQS